MSMIQFGRMEDGEPRVVITDVQQMGNVSLPFESVKLFPTIGAQAQNSDNSGLHEVVFAMSCKEFLACVEETFELLKEK